MIHQQIEPDWSSWREAARRLLAAGIEPAAILWDDGTGTQVPLIAEKPPSHGTRLPAISLPRRFVDSARLVAHHSSPDRWNLLYRLAWRITREPHLMQIESDPDVLELTRLAGQIRRDIHKMHAFVRFRRVEDEQGERWIAWYAPDHDVARLAAPHFRERFQAMRWSILTPLRSIHWNGEELLEAEGAPRSTAPGEDELEELWRTYYGSIFNPARLNLRATRAEMPSRKWNLLPETRLIPSLIRDASSRQNKMIAAQRTAPSASPYLPGDRSIPSMRDASAGCQGCPLHLAATQTIFGEGPENARLVLIGEQPGNLEDLSGRPFIGPAGEVLDRLLAEAGFDRAEIYLTNAVKHFKFERQGKRRIHKAPTQLEIAACRPWLEAEIDAIRPAVLVTLGASASRAVFGAAFRLMEERGRPQQTRWAEATIATIHPSAILRVPGQRQHEYEQMLRDDLQVALDCLRRTLPTQTGNLLAE